MKHKKILALSISLLLLSGCNSNFIFPSSSNATTSEITQNNSSSSQIDDSSVTSIEDSSEATSDALSSVISSDVVSENPTSETISSIISSDVISSNTTSEEVSLEESSEATSETTSQTPSSETSSEDVSSVTSSSSNTSVDQDSSVNVESKTYTVTFGTQTGSDIPAICSSGISLGTVSGKVFGDSNSDTPSNSVRLGSSSATGSISFNLTNASVIKSVIVDCERYGTDGNSKLKVSLSNGENKTISIGTRDEYVFSFTNTSKSNSITFENLSGSKARVNIYGIELSSEVVNSGNNSSSSVSSTTSQSSSVNSTSSSGGNNGSVDYGTLFDPANDSYSGNYYSSISDASSGDTLVKALGKLIASTHTDKGYDGLWNAYYTTDVKPGTNTIWDMYSNCKYEVGSDQCGNYSGEGSCYNREHVVPQSWFEKASPMKNDVFHVVPTDGYVNGWRSNYPIAEVSSASKTSSNGSKLGPSSVSGISGTVFEPIDEYKGDFARIYFYMCTRYYDKVGSWGGGVFSSSYPYLKNAYFNLYLKWAIDDPVSQKEIDRNNAAYKHQGNRNPYVDCPSLFYRAFIL